MAVNFLGTINYMLRFVILLHETPPAYPRKTHFDLMLEHGDALWTWALDRLPEAGQSVPAERLLDHRLAYLDYEGEVAGSRGQVCRIDAGDFDVVAESESRLVVALRGDKLRGTLTLERTESEPHRWRISLAAGEATSSLP
jgi:DNA polymerase Ligase (LigD)